MSCFLLISLLIIFPYLANAQSFSCRIGTTPACLDYSDKVCGFGAMCVDSSAQCFDSSTCNYEGFTCKSNLTNCADEYDAVIVKYNSLVDAHNQLLEEHKQLIDDNQKALSEIDGLSASQVCVLQASTLEEAQTCVQ